MKSHGRLLKIGESYGLNKNGPLTGQELYELIQKTPAEVLKQPVHMSSDEEGNDFGSLWSFEVTEKGIVLWPADGGHDHPSQGVWGYIGV